MPLIAIIPLVIVNNLEVVGRHELKLILSLAYILVCVGIFGFLAGPRFEGRRSWLIAFIVCAVLDILVVWFALGVALMTGFLAGFLLRERRSQEIIHAASCAPPSTNDASR